MGRLSVTILLILSVLHASNINIYERNCVPCHRHISPSLEKLFFDYLLKYSSERRVKRALVDYLKHPTKKRSVVSEEVIRKYGLMPKTRLSDTDLHKAIDTYWETYKVFGKIK